MMRVYDDELTQVPLHRLARPGKQTNKQTLDHQSRRQLKL